MKPERILIVTTVLSLVFLVGADAGETPRFGQPILITSAGQSADILMAATLCKKLRLEAKSVSLAGESDLAGVKTLLVVAGFSSKGLGAAGISREEEMERVKKLLTAARQKGVSILTMHLGGKARRGTQSDDFNRLASEFAQHLIVVQQGNEDAFFTDIAKENVIPIDVVRKVIEAVPPLEKAFRKPPELRQDQ
ncbi:MAG: DUF6305 family protein [Ignavibacteria bacterium]|nr:DUF6305 family protein [Ignavibacteria bacterium]